METLLTHFYYINWQQENPIPAGQHKALIWVPSVSQGLGSESNHFATVPLWGNNKLCMEDKTHFPQPCNFKDKCMHP